MAERGLLYVFLSHDVDWPIQGPGRDHVLARKDRFSPEVIEKVVRQGYNPYFMVPELMDIEAALKVKSTFFFRPKYDDGTIVDCYGSTIREALRKGWEVGWHINDASTLETLRREKQVIERVLRQPVYGTRAHYHRIDPANLPLLEQLGIKYDASIINRRDAIDVSDMGSYHIGKLLEIPVTLAEVFMFAPQYMNVPEEKIVETVAKAVDVARQVGLMSLAWHDCSLKMIKGRKFQEVLEFLVSQPRLKIVRGIDVYQIMSRRVSHE
jgi:hypothetical protein